MTKNPPYYTIRNGRAFFSLGKDRARRADMRPSIALGLDGPRARAAAWTLYAQWKEQSGNAEPGEPAPRQWPAGSLGSWFEAYRQSARWKAKATATRYEWEAIWKYIGPAMGHRPLREITPAEFEAFQTGIEERYGPMRRWRCVKIARALFKAAESYRVLAKSPAHTLPNPMPAPRTAIWFAGEIGDLMDAAERIERPAMRLAIELAWQTLMQPVDVRRLTLAKRRKDRSGSFFVTTRAKTGREVHGVITDDLSARIDAYIEGLGLALPPTAPFLRTVTGHEYTKARFLDDFDKVRRAAFGPNETRRFQDIRRSGSVEAAIAGATPEMRASILANNLHKDPFLDETYTPPTITAARRMNEIREAGRKLLEAERLNETGKVGTKVGMEKGKTSA